MRQQRTGLMIAGLAALVAVTLVLVVMALKHGRGVTGSAPAVTPQSTVAQTATPTTTRTTSTTASSQMAVVGGAMTYADSSSGTDPGSRSWVRYFSVKDVGKKVLMKDGLTTKQATQDLTGGPYLALAVATGDDDYAAGRTGEESADDIAALVTKAKVPSGSVIVVPMSPASSVPGYRITAFNAALEKAVKAKGWVYCDAWSSVRGDDGQWADKAEDSVKNGNGASPAAAKQVGPAVLACMSPSQAAIPSVTSTAIPTSTS